MTKEPRPHPREFGASLYDKMVAKVDRAYAEWVESLGGVAEHLYDRVAADKEPDAARKYGRLEGSASQLGIFRGNDTKTQIALAKERYDARER